MFKRLSVPVVASVLLLTLVLNGQIVVSALSQFLQLTSKESEVVALVDGTSVYNYDLELERIALDQNVSGYSFRSSGSPGANEAAEWIKEQFESVGLEETRLESFEFTTWNLLAQPSLVIDDDGSADTTDDQVAIGSFQSEHYSWPTPEGGIFSELVTLPLPEAQSRGTVGNRPYNASAWNAVNTTGKILLIGREIRWTDRLHSLFVNKLTAQPPAAVIFTWGYSWMSWAPPMFSSIGGRPASGFGSYFWDLKIPAGWVNYEDGLWIRSRKAGNASLSARVDIPAVIGSGPHYNVVGKISGTVKPEKTVIISGHYDTVMTAGFCDNGAGTAGVIELARVFLQAFRQNLYKPEATLVFVAFAGEELGLVGAVNYMKQHEAELKNVLAVINLDCIGGDTMEISEAYTDDTGMNLQDIVTKAAGDLGVSVKVTDPGGSDQEAFRNPMLTDDSYKLFWGSRPGIRNMTRVKSSIMIGSYPLFISDIWTNRTAGPGWIHTAYDNSSSTEALGWVTADNLESHVQVAGLSVMRVLATTFSPFILQVVSVFAVTSVAVVGVALFERRRVSALLKKAYDDVLSHIELKEVLYIIILTSLFLFTSFILHSRVARAEIIENGYPTTVLFEYIGTPFEMIGIGSSAMLSSRDGGEAVPVVGGSSYRGSTVLLWQGFLLDLGLCLLLAFAITYGVAKIMSLREYAEGQRSNIRMRSIESQQ